MFLPLYSESEMRVWPFATGALILINIACFFLQHQLPSTEMRIPVDVALIDPLDREEFDNSVDEDGRIAVEVPGFLAYALHHGNGVHPIQWLTSFFLHGGVGHLLGNLIFLWVFGQVVEGVVGHRLFIILYLALGIGQNALEQILLLGSDFGTSLGASGAIYSIMLLAAWFAPQDNIQCVLLVFFRPFMFAIPVMMMALFYFLFDLLYSVQAGFAMSTPLLHSIGGLFGFVTGFALLKLQVVENDHRDALSLLSDAAGRQPKTKLTKRQVQDKQAAQEASRMAQQEQLRVAENSLLMHFKAGNLEAILSQFHRVKRINPKFEWSEPQLRQLVSWAQQQSDWNRAISLSQQYLSLYEKDYPDLATVISLNMANVLLRKQLAPIKARKVLRTLAGQTLTADQQTLFQKLLKECDRQIEQGELELADE